MNEETDAEFITRCKYGVYNGLPLKDADRLLALATRGAKIPDEPTEEMIEAGAKALAKGYNGGHTHWLLFIDEARAMLSAALGKNTQ